MNKRKWFGALGVVIVLALATFGAWRLSLHSPLPDPNDVEKVSGQFYHEGQQRDVDVAIPDRLIPNVWSTLQPARKVSEPGDGQVWGSLKITTKDGRAWSLVLFDSAGTLSYEVGVGLELRSFYRAGSLRSLEHILLELHKAAN